VNVHNYEIYGFCCRRPLH